MLRSASSDPEIESAIRSLNAPNGCIACDADRLQSHHRAVKSYTLHDYGEVPRNLRLKGRERVVDAGGGTGSLALLLLEEYPQLSVTILDQPEVISTAEQSTNCVNLHAANIFENWGIKVDVVVMARVLHDWNDDLAIRKLRNARNALPQGGKLFLVKWSYPKMELVEDFATSIYL